MNGLQIDIVFISGFAFGFLYSEYEDKTEFMFLLSLIGIRFTFW